MCLFYCADVLSLLIDCHQSHVPLVFHVYLVYYAYLVYYTYSYILSHLVFYACLNSYNYKVTTTENICAKTKTLSKVGLQPRILNLTIRCTSTVLKNLAVNGYCSLHQCLTTMVPKNNHPSKVVNTILHNPNNTTFILSKSHVNQHSHS